jgi:hypothetical protein
MKVEMLQSGCSRKKKNKNLMKEGVWKINKKSDYNKNNIKLHLAEIGAQWRTSKPHLSHTAADQMERNQITRFSIKFLFYQGSRGEGETSLPTPTSKQFKSWLPIPYTPNSKITLCTGNEHVTIIIHF